jgi:hypothetical protein
MTTPFIRIAVARFISRLHCNSNDESNLGENEL